MFKVNAASREVFIYDDIGPSWAGMIDSGTVIEALAQLGGGDRVKLRINSPGGDVQEALAIFNAIKRHPGPVDTYADSLAASSGSYIFAAGENRIVAQNGVLMIHDPWGITMGNAADHRRAADIYDKFAENMANDYATSAGIEPEAMRELMIDETWLNAQEAVDMGFATAIGDRVADDPVVAAGRFAKAPTTLAANVKAGSRTLYTVQHLRLRNAVNS